MVRLKICGWNPTRAMPQTRSPIFASVHRPVQRHPGRRCHKTSHTRRPTFQISPQRRACSTGFAAKFGCGTTHYSIRTESAVQGRQGGGEGGVCRHDTPRGWPSVIAATRDPMHAPAPGCRSRAAHRPPVRPPIDACVVEKAAEQSSPHCRAPMATEPAIPQPPCRCRPPQNVALGTSCVSR